ncbi:AsnC family transcriptional regulator [Thermobispora bispora]|jgi:DNA-binding Lrp family transcriptional regulator|uniref:Transcriptional regulator, AsnC family n=1 Tax=Thermobispora bispora (strain ATCC 19993 / DSM 43833 / CBS 139.67 / JCM 10125 / KCTC 9307 / NBRC 14880 / R51) TaxID=469371 RepID=D6Y7T0_THEBD|nr:Lrp/AsnC family transcriptional regulator [Thermobispora bispora]MBO2475937.1 Lrp/AsnC family transcriptional regulator [Actinomycetales bacterium]MDI9580687.1 Lrp/AsnC family transcriptional regulator [Thermobispora sp.]ADG87749.1 transcriptional regulator, AsnC family [Thermobispora bispora DSM 43833]MBX6169623.1 Lrp/AsnC family transcriptional regulator [Thermobispora bispora]QSI47653.1 Lrp/AsnC family transcriptional regulator [Thermobispora bispora]
MLDALDARLLITMRAHPRIGLTELARLLGVARGTVQSRLEKLTARGVIRDFGPTIDPEAIGYPILAFVSLQIAQGRLPEAVEALNEIPQILEVYGTSGHADLLCRVVAQSTPHLQEIISRILSSPAVHRTDTMIALSTQIPARVDPLLRAAAVDPRRR